MRLKAHIPVLLLFLATPLFLATSLKGQWREVQLDEGDMAVDLAEALTFKKYPTYPQYVEMMHHFAENYPEICRLDTFGTSSQGRLLLALKISDNVEQDEAEASFMYSSSMHGNELVGYPLMLRLIDYLLSGYGVDPEVDRLVDGLEIWINPLANPDGTYYPDNDLSVAGSIRETAEGVDMNREFPDPVAGEAVNDTSGRAQETRAMMALLQEHRFTMSANIHSGEEVVNYPWDHQETVHTDDAWLQFVSREYADEARVVDPNYMSLFTDGITNGAQWYKIFGGRQDYVTYYLEGRELTLELCTDFRLNSELLNEYWLKNQRSLINYMSQCLYGIRGLVTDADSGLPLEALVEIPGHDNYHSSVHSSAAHGDFYRLLEEDSYDLVVSSPGYHSDTIPGVHVVNYQAILLNIALQTVKSSSQGDASVAFRIYPNPADSELFIQPACEPGVVELMIYSSEGILFRKESSHYTGAPMRVGLNELPSGPFLLRISSAEQTIVRMLIRE